MKKEIVLRPYQETAIERALWSIDKFDNNSLIVMPTGCHSYGYPITMYDGSIKEVQDIIIGDLVMGVNSSAREVIDLYRGFEKFYRVKTIKGEYFDVNENHVLHLISTTIKDSHKNVYPKEVNITVKEYLNWAKSRKHLYKLIKQGYEQPDLNLPIPYLLGVWLGGGSSNCCQITSADDEIITYLSSFADTNNLNYRKLSSKYGHSLTSKTEIPHKKKAYNIFRSSLAGYSLFNNKHIPEDYFKSSKECRLQLLAGILDTDGSLGNGNYDLTLSNERLFDGCIRLIRSLGLHCVKRYRKDVNGKEIYRTTISGDLEEIPCLITRKQATKRLQKKRATVYGFTIEELNEQNYFGFELDGNHLYIDGQGFIQHNSGKSLIIGGIADNLRKEILILQPSKEILEQNVEKLSLYVPEDEIGIYSASAKRKDINKYNFATIQSIYKKPELFKHIGLCLVDEAHQVNPKNAKGMFSSFLRSIGNPVTIGLTATPFRNIPYAERVVGGYYVSKLSLRLINRVNPRVWNRISYNINNHELVEQGYLAPLKYFDRSQIEHKRIPLNKSGTDFDLIKYDRLFQPLETQIIDSITKAQDHRKAILVFCASLEQAERFSKAVAGSRWVSGETPLQERTEIIEGFKSGKIKVVFNRGVLSVGFDFPALDTIYLLRPTKSLGLFYQMLGRGVRTALDKKDCYVLDYSGSFSTLGRIEDIKYYNEKGYWEVYANGEKMHGKVIYEREI